MDEETRGPKFRMYAENRLGYLWLPKNEYLEFKEHAYSGDGIYINITPLAGVAENPQFVGGLLTACSSANQVFELELRRDRGEKYPEDEQFARYTYRIYEEFPEDVTKTIEAASTNFDTPVKELLIDSVWFEREPRKDMEPRYVAGTTSLIGIMRDK